MLIVLSECMNYGLKEGKVASFNMNLFRSLNVLKTKDHKYLVVLGNDLTWFGIKTCATEQEALQEIDAITQAYASGIKVYQIGNAKSDNKTQGATGHVAAT